MKKGKIFQGYARSGQKGLSRINQWKRRFSIVLAFVVPGLPQILSRRQNLLRSLLFFFGAGALIAMMISLTVSGSDTRAFDYIYARSRPDLGARYPTSIYPSAPSADTLVPILPLGEPSHVQPFFRELWYFHIILYGVCAMLSFWDEWKTSRNAEEQDE